MVNRNRRALDASQAFVDNLISESVALRKEFTVATINLTDFAELLRKAADRLREGAK